MINLNYRIVLLSSILLMFTLNSCKKIVDSIPNSYFVYLEFRDKDGKNLLNEFDVNSLQQDITATSDKGDIVRSSYSIIEINNEKILHIQSTTLPDNRLNAINYTIQNEELMGNSEKNILHTKWSFSNNNSVLTQCVINDRELNPVKNSLTNHYVLKQEV